MKNFVLAATTVIALGAASQASAAPVVISLTGAYNTVTMGGTSWTGDFQTQCCSNRPNMVASTLLGGLPVYTPDGGPTINDISGTNQILWWTPGTYNGDVVTSSGSGTVLSPFSSTTMYPPTGPNGNVGNDTNGFLTAEFTGSFSLATASNVTFTLGADDDAFFFVDGNLVTGLGGVHADTPAPTNTVTLSAGSHSIELFYADRFQNQAALTFGLDSTGITGVPETSTWGMMVLGFAGLGFAGYRKAKNGRAALSAV